MATSTISTRELVVDVFVVRPLLRKPGKPLVPDRTELDSHFEFPLKDSVELCNEYFRKKLFHLIESDE